MTTDLAAALALTVFVLGSLCISVVRVAIHLRRTGSSGIRVANLAHPQGRWVFVFFAAAWLLGGLGPVLTLLRVVSPSPTPGVVSWLGLLVAVAGFAAVIVSQQAMGASWRIGVRAGERTDLVTTGVFAVVRNPIYTAVVAAFTGLALLVPTLLAPAMLAFTVAAVEIQVRAVEEPHLLRAHGPAYLAYAQATGRFVPGVGRGLGATVEQSR